VGLIGAGNFATNMILPNLRNVKKTHIKAIADAQGEKAKFAAKKYNCEVATSDYKDILNDKEIDLAIIATRHNLHARIASEALKKDKNVHLEKPMALNMNQLKDVIKAAQNSKGRLMTGFNRRFAPHIIEAKKILAQVQTPLLMYYRINAGHIPKESWVHDPEEGGGRIIGEVCHFIDLLQFLANSPPVKVYATQINAQEPVIDKDNVEILIDFANGSRGSILYTSLGSKAAPKEYLEIFADEKVFIVDNFRSSRSYIQNKTKKIGKYAQDKGHHGELEAFTQAILNGDLSPIPLDEQVLATLTTFKVLKSLETGKPIEINLSEVL
jgi:polar amino acid transport system substrate-binding protein